ncbi:MAG TPA: archaellin/type IV pilin N-terminal domain-containing protein, partial [archaeon]|nr:archaellin/type IV pilin N-terminal domain-containing protein [archaeon]
FFMKAFQIRTSRGFSPVIAVVLMVAVAVAAAVIAYLWGIGLLSGIIASSDTGEVTQTATIAIENIDAGNNVITLRCKGDITTIQQIYVTTSPGNVTRLDVNNADHPDGNLRWGALHACSAGGQGILSWNLRDSNMSNNVFFDVNVGHVVRIVGTNNAEAVKQV